MKKRWKKKYYFNNPEIEFLGLKIPDQGINTIHCRKTRVLQTFLAQIGESPIVIR